jgi:hypothetical protein
MTFCFDLDGTICTDTRGDYALAAPYPEMVAEINRLHAEGHHVIVYTARGSGTGIDWRAETERQLAAWGVAYDFLFLGKPPADVYVDDKSVDVAGFRLARLGCLDPAAPPAIFPPFPGARTNEP